MDVVILFFVLLPIFAISKLHKVNVLIISSKFLNGLVCKEKFKETYKILFFPFYLKNENEFFRKGLNHRKHNIYHKFQENISIPKKNERGHIGTTVSEIILNFCIMMAL